MRSPEELAEWAGDEAVRIVDAMQGRYVSGADTSELKCSIANAILDAYAEGAGVHR